MDPNPVKHPAVLLARVRDALEPILSQAGFLFDGRNNPRNRGLPHLWIDYTRGHELLSLRWDAWKATLSLELAEAENAVETIADVCMDGVRSSSDLENRVDDFIQHVRQSERLKGLETS